MDHTTGNDDGSLENLRLPELQARYLEVTGELTRCPNRGWLIRKITESLARRKDACGSSTAGERRVRSALKGLSIEDLQARHLEVIGRATTSSHAGYLRWRLHQAERGRIRIGVLTRRSAHDADLQVLPLRMPTAAVAQLDEARRRLGLPSRAELFRRALHGYLVGTGEREVARLFIGAAEREQAGLLHRDGATGGEVARESPLSNASS